MKKTYISPNAVVLTITPATIMVGSTLNPEDTNPTVIVSDETFTDGFFSSRGGGSFFDDEE